MLFRSGFEKAIVFGMYEKTQTIFDNDKRDLPVANAISGAVAGLSASFLVTPYERIKILLQNGSSVQRETFRLSSLFRGLSMTFTREVPGFAIYFTTYEWMKYNLHNKKLTAGELTQTIRRQFSATDLSFITNRDSLVSPNMIIVSGVYDQDTEIGRAHV